MFVKQSVICPVGKANINSWFVFLFCLLRIVSSLHIPSVMGHLNLPVSVFLDYFLPAPGYITVSA